jgi:multidrug transporter EmrE-like cation transporter
MNDLRAYLYLGSCLLLAVCSQIIMKWQVNKAGPSPAESAEIASYVFRLLFNPWVITALVLTFVAGIAWLLALSRLDLSHAYPFVGLLFVAMVFVGISLFGEAFAWQKLAGAALIAIGIALSSQG